MYLVCDETMYSMHVRAPALSLVSIVRHLPSPLRSRSSTWKGNNGTDRMMGSRWAVDLTCEAARFTGQQEQEEEEEEEQHVVMKLASVCYVKHE